MYEFMTKIALTFSVFNLVILCFLVTKMIDYRDKAFAVYHFLRSHCAALVELDRFINGEVKDESKANKQPGQDLLQSFLKKAYRGETQKLAEER